MYNKLNYFPERKLNIHDDIVIYHITIQTQICNTKQQYEPHVSQMPTRINYGEAVGFIPLQHIIDNGFVTPLSF